MKKTNEPNLDADRTALATIRDKLTDARKVLADARTAKEKYTGHAPVELHLDLAEAERAVLVLEREEFDAADTLQRSLFAHEVASGDEDAQKVAGLFDALTSAGDRVATLKAEEARVLAAAAEEFVAAKAAHARLDQKRGAAGDPGVPRPHDQGIALVAFLATTKPANRTPSGLRAALKFSGDIEAVEGRTLEEKARTIVQGMGRAKPADTKVRMLDAEIFDMKRRLLEREREAKETREREEERRLRREEEERQLAERNARELRRLQDEATAERDRVQAAWAARNPPGAA